MTVTRFPSDNIVERARDLFSDVYDPDAFLRTLAHAYAIGYRRGFPRPIDELFIRQHGGAEAAFHLERDPNHPAAWGLIAAIQLAEGDPGGYCSLRKLLHHGKRTKENVELAVQLLAMEEGTLATRRFLAYGLAVMRHHLPDRDLNDLFLFMREKVGEMYR